MYYHDYTWMYRLVIFSLYPYSIIITYYYYYSPYRGLEFGTFSFDLLRAVRITLLTPIPLKCALGEDKKKAGKKAGEVVILILLALDGGVSSMSCELRQKKRNWSYIS